MKKKASLLISLAALIAGGSFAAVATLGHNHYTLDSINATEKSFTFDATVGSEQFEDHYTSHKPAEISVVTGVGSNLETTVSLPKNETEDFAVGYGNNGRFVRSWETYSNSDFEVVVGINNLTSISVSYGCDKTTYTVASELHCYIDVKDEDGDWHNYVSGSSGSAFNTDLDLSWVKSSEEYTVKAVRVRVGASGGSIYWGEPLYIKSISLNWSC